MEVKGKKVFITGGAGFLGSFLSEEMLCQGASVTIYDRFSQGRSRIQHLEGNPKVQIIQGDCGEYDKLLEAIKDSEWVWHLSSNTDIPAGLKDTMVDLRDGVVATRNVLEAMRHQGIKKMIFPSSGAIYGETHKGFRSESQGPTLPISLYGAQKISCEAFISAYAHLFGTQAWIFRFGNIISSRITHGVIRDFIKKLRANPSELEVLGDGTQTKSYMLAEECLEGIQYVVSHTPLKPEEGFCDVFNLGAPDETVVLDIAKMVIEEMKLPNCKVRTKGGERGWKGDQAKIALDISKVRKLGWAPKHNSGEAVRISVQRMLRDMDKYE